MAARSAVESHLKTGGESLEFSNRVSGTHEISPKCQEVFEELKIRRKHRFIIFRIGDEEIEVESTGPRSQVSPRCKIWLNCSFYKSCLRPFLDF